MIGPSALAINSTENISNLSVVVEWDEVDDFLNTTYKITWTGDDTNTTSHSVTEQSSYTITELTLDTVYNITVTAANRCGTGPVNRTSVSIPTGTTFTIVIL